MKDTTADSLIQPVSYASFYTWHAVYTVSSLLRPHGTVQTTSQATLDLVPNFINGNDVQLFVQTHGTVNFLISPRCSFRLSCHRSLCSGAFTSSFTWCSWIVLIHVLPAAVDILVDTRSLLIWSSGCKANIRRGEHEAAVVSDGMDWSNPMMWQQTPSINPPSSTRQPLLWSTCSKLLRRSQPLNLLTLEKDLAGSMGLNIDDFNHRIKVHEHLGNLILEFLNQHHQTIKARSPEDDTLQKYHDQTRARAAAVLSIAAIVTSVYGQRHQLLRNGAYYFQLSLVILCPRLLSGVAQTVLIHVGGC